MIKHVLVATDGSPGGRRTVDFAADFAERYGAKVTILHVVTGESDMGALRDYAKAENLHLDDGPSMSRLYGEGVLNEASAAVARGGSTAVETIIANGRPADEIVAQAKERKPDVIIVGHRGLGRVKTMLLGSVSRGVVQDAPCTVIVVR